MRRQLFPAKVHWLWLWRERWVLLEFLNQVAHGEYLDALTVCHHYSGSPNFAYKFFRAAKRSITTKEQA